MLATVTFCLIVAVADGDTLTARCGDPAAFQQVKVRIAEIDAPEKAQPFGERSRQSLAALCFRKMAKITIETRDKYGRTVARVECQGKDVSLLQVQAGMAWRYVKYSRDPTVRDAEVLARAARQGLWVDAEPVAPWAWRQSTR